MIFERETLNCYNTTAPPILWQWWGTNSILALILLSLPTIQYSTSTPLLHCSTLYVNFPLCISRIFSPVVTGERCGYEPCGASPRRRESSTHWARLDCTKRRSGRAESGAYCRPQNRKAARFCCLSQARQDWSVNILGVSSGLGGMSI